MLMLLGRAMLSMYNSCDDTVVCMLHIPVYGYYTKCIQLQKYIQFMHDIFQILSDKVDNQLFEHGQNAWE